MGKSVLGRGFDGLLPTGFDVEHVASPGETIRQLSINQLIANPDQPRREFDEEALQELAASIREHGIIQPLVATPKGQKYRIVAGERRFRAAKIAGLSTVPVIVRNHKELEELEIALIENVQRVDLSPLEQAVSIMRLRDQFSMTPKQIGKKLGKADTTISNIMRLLQLPKQAILALQEKRISEGHARAILAVKFSEKLQSELLGHILTSGWTVRQCEEWVKQQKIRVAQKSSSISTTSTQAVTRLSNRGMAVTLHEKKRGGTLTFAFKNEKELQGILAYFEAET